MPWGEQEGQLPVIRWSWRGGRPLRLERRLALYFEVLALPGSDRGELRVYGQRALYRWGVPLTVLSGEVGGRSLAAQLDVLPPADAATLLPRWDEGRCEIHDGVGSLQRFRAAMIGGSVRFTLKGRDLWGDFSLLRTPMVLEGRPQWLLRREEAATPARPEELV